MSASTIYDLLAKRYPAPEWAFFTEVRNSTGYASKVRTADALAMSLWPSRGIHLHGFEVKVSRSDWRRELKEPEKAEDFARLCDFWWIVAPHGIVPVDELPQAWGLIEQRGKRLVRAREAYLREPEPLTRRRLAALLRATFNQRPGAKELEDARKQGVKDGEKLATSRSKRRLQAYEDLHKKVREFEKASGLYIEHGWALPELGRNLKAFLERGSKPIDALRDLQHRAEQINRDIVKQIELHEAFHEPTSSGEVSA